MSYLRVQHAPFAILYVLTTGLAVCYTFNKLEEKISPALPFISELGMFQWETGLFTATLMTTAILILITQYFRLRWVLLVKSQPTLLFTAFNIFTFFVGMVSVFGMVGVAVFPVSTAGENHERSSIVCFVCAILYMAAQTLVSFGMTPESICSAFLRSVLTIVAAVCYFLTLEFGQKGRTEWHSGHYNHQFWERLPTDKGYNDLLISAFTEWMLVYSFMFMFLTFVQDFRQMTVIIVIKPKKVQYV